MPNGPLHGVRVVEIGDESGEYCGLLLAGLGAEVWRVEPPNGSSSRNFEPFYEDLPGAERSLFFWQYNRGKRSVVLDTQDETDRARLHKLVSHADVVLQSGRPPPAGEWALSEGKLAERPDLIDARLTPFGSDGPWASFKAGDLVHLALGGVVMNNGYDPEPNGFYDSAPIAPAMWQAYHIAGEQLAMGIVAALVHRQTTGQGQAVSLAIHEAVAKNTELDVMSWLMRRVPLFRQTCRHSQEELARVSDIAQTKDGRWLMTYRMSPVDDDRLITFLQRYGWAGKSKSRGTTQRTGAIPGSDNPDARGIRMIEQAHRFIRRFTYDRAPWVEAQAAGLMWCQLRKPHESAIDEHWLTRGSVAEVEHPELGRSFLYPVSKWISNETPWTPGRRAPLLGEDQAELQQLIAAPPPTGYGPGTPPKSRARSNATKPFALDGIRVLDFTWFLASAGATRFLSAFGAECLKVEWHAHPDTRTGVMAPVGGRAARDTATRPLRALTDPEMGGQFNNKNAGKRSISLNVRHPDGLAIAKQLVALSDVVAEGFSPGVLQRWGLGYDVLCALRPEIIYAQQSGMGGAGTYGRLRAVGPIAASFVGLTEMSGLPEPAIPTGWGYSYLDWIGAYSFALAILSALYHRNKTGKGQWIDASQCESGIFVTGTSVVDWSAHSRVWRRTGNASTYLKAAPHGVFRAAGDDRWIAISCFTNDEWHSLARVADHDEWTSDARFATPESRYAHQDDVHRLVSEWTVGVDPYQLMTDLQRAGVPAGVCQTAEDRVDRDPQLAALNWLTEVTGSKIGTWPVAEVPVKLSASPAYIGGQIDRGAPVYGEDNEYVYGELLGFSTAKISKLKEREVI